MLGKFGRVERALYEDLPMDGTQELSQLDLSPDHQALAAIDPVFATLLGRLTVWAERVAKMPSYENKEGYHRAEQDARYYAGPLGHGH